MADELSLTGRFYYSKSGSIVERNTGATLVTISGTEVKSGIESVGTSNETITIPASPGYVFVKNLDSTNFIQLGPDSTNYFLKLLAGQWAIFPINGTALNAKANTAACNLEYIVVSL
jgi:hypothetical protein